MKTPFLIIDAMNSCQIWAPNLGGIFMPLD